MQITTWNVNGLRALLRKNGWEWMQAQGPDVICLQEIKARSDQLDGDAQANFGRYHAHWNPAQKAGYSGVLSLSKEAVEQTSAGLGEERFAAEGRIVQSRLQDFVLFNAYFPNGKRDMGRLTYKLDFYARLLEVCDALHAKGEKVVICGDFNTAHQEMDLKNASQNRKISGFLPEERAWVSKYLEHRFVDAFRALYPDRIQYTWWALTSNARARNVGWRIDYFLVSEGLMPQVQDVVIHDEVMGSDHCPVSLILR